MPVGQRRLGVPDRDRLGAEAVEREAHVAVVERPREGDDRDPRAVAHASPSSSTVNDSISGFASSSARHPLDLAARLGRVVRLELDVDEPPDARVRDREAELAERLLDRLALRVEDALLRADEHGRLHSTTFGSSRYAENGMPVRRSNASTYRARVPATTSSGSSGPG